MKEWKFGLIVGVWVLSLWASFAQQMPPRIRWMELETPRLRLIFPAEWEGRARDIAAYIHRIQPSVTYPFKPPKRLPLILNPYTSVSNGYVMLAPWHSRWYMQPWPDTYFGNTTWARTLARHEYRHAVQFQGINRGSVKIARILGGDIGLARAMLWAYPTWYFEGDAVFSETLLSQGGRGRSGYFRAPVEMMARTYSPEDKDYYKFYLGSYKRYYPSHYHLGYYLVERINRNYGTGVWDTLIREASLWAFVPGSMHRALKRRTGRNYRQWTREVLDELAKSKSLATEGGTALPVDRPRAFTHDIWPYLIKGDTLLFLRYGFDLTPAVYALAKGEHKPRKLIDIPGNYFSANDTYLTWLEYKPHPRWEEMLYTRVAVLDRKHKKKFYLTGPGKYQSPALAPAGSHLVVVRYDTLMHPGLELWELSPPRRTVYRLFTRFESIRHPSFEPGTGRVVFSALIPGKGTAVYRWDPRTDSMERISPYFKEENINYPRMLRERLFYVSDLHGSDVYARDGEERIWRYTFSSYGAQTFAITKDSVIYAALTPEGMRLMTAPAKGTPVSGRSEPRFDPRVYGHPLKEDTAVRPGDFSVRKYRRLRSYLNLHSWFWAAGVIDTLWGAAAGAWMSDVMNEWDVRFIGYMFNGGEWRYETRVTYQRWFPRLSLSMGGGQLPAGRLRYRTVEGRIGVPLNFSSGIWSRRVYGDVYARIWESGGQVYYPYGMGVSFRIDRQRAYRHVGSRKAFRIQGGYEVEPLSLSERWIGSASIQVPGPGRNDYIAAEFRGDLRFGAFPFSSPLLPVRGGFPEPYDRFYGLGVTYHAPLAYPEWGWKRVFYLKRLRYQLLGDIGHTSRLWQSAGFRLLGDWHFLGLKVEFPLGIQVTYVRPLERWTVRAIIGGVEW